VPPNATKGARLGIYRPNWMINPAMSRHQHALKDMRTECKRSDWLIMILGMVTSLNWNSLPFPLMRPPISRGQLSNVLNIHKGRRHGYRLAHYKTLTSTVDDGDTANTFRRESKLLL